jgi:site-specific DNA-methyltransferase (adenine-specific)
MEITSKIRITNEDNMELMKRYPDNYFDLAIVDPPYGIGFDKENTSMSSGERKDGTKRIMKSWSNPRKKGYTTKNWDSSIPNKEYFDELKRVSKNYIIWGGNYMTEYLKPHGGWIVWEKGVPDGMSLSQAELAYNTCLNSINIFKVLWAGYKKADNEQRFHPTQKPVALYKWLLDKYSKPGDKILDTHLGSGSIAIACHDYGFDLTACELDTEYYNKAIERITNHTNQQKLF